MNIITTSKLQRFLILLSLSAGWLLLISSAARANSWPPMAVGFFYLPLVASLVSFGIGFVLIILLEALVLILREKLKFWRSVKVVTVANLLSTLAGFGFVIALSLSPIGFSFQQITLDSVIFWLFVAAVCLGLGFCTAKTLKNLSKLWRGNFVIWSIVWALILLAELLIIFLFDSTNNIVLQQLASTIYYSVGFVMSVVVEGFWLSRCLPEKSATIGKTVVIANLRSYAYIAIPITIFLLLNKSK